jgi:hypothetical protein
MAQENHADLVIACPKDGQPPIYFLFDKRHWVDAGANNWPDENLWGFISANPDQVDPIETLSEVMSRIDEESITIHNELTCQIY